MATNDVLSDHLARLEDVVLDDTTPEEMLALADYLDKEAVVLAFSDGEAHVGKLVYGLTLILGVPWDTDTCQPMLDDIPREEARRFVVTAAELVDVLDDPAKRQQRIEANQVTAALIRGHQLEAQP